MQMEWVEISTFLEDRAATWEKFLIIFYVI